MAGMDDLFLPQLIDPDKGVWTNQETDLRNAAVDLVGKRAMVPRAHTEAQRLARLHEACHVKESPKDITKTLPAIMAHASSMGLPPIDTEISLRIAKMLEENRIDWILWSKYHVDDRPARESLDWSKMPVPNDDPVYALEMVLQLAWSCWSSVGGDIKGGPPHREPDPDMKGFFLMCWNAVHYHSADILPVLVRACQRMYAEPTHEARDKAAAEIASFFPVKEPKAKQPPKKDEQQQAEKEAEEAEAEIEKQRQAEAGGETTDPELLAEPDTGGEGAPEDSVAELHDHTLGIRRPSLRIARRDVPQFTGTRLVFPHRYMIDKSVFSRRVLTEGGIMVDGSGSMRWSNEDLQAVLALMPAVWVGVYSGFRYYPGLPRPERYTADKAEKIVGRICILAKNGRFAHFDGPDIGSTGANNVDVEALQVLAKWPEPRIWLSDGLVTGGKYMYKPPIDPRWRDAGRAWHASNEGVAHMIDRTNATMKRHNILRVETKEDMLALLKRRRVTLYRNCVHVLRHSVGGYYPPFLQPEPVTFQL